jgi:hypothetical protein
MLVPLLSTIHVFLSFVAFAAADNTVSASTSTFTNILMYKEMDLACIAQDIDRSHVYTHDGSLRNDHKGQWSGTGTESGIREGRGRLIYLFRYRSASPEVRERHIVSNVAETFFPMSPPECRANRTISSPELPANCADHRTRLGRNCTEHVEVVTCVMMMSQDSLVTPIPPVRASRITDKARCLILTVYELRPWTAAR